MNYTLFICADRFLARTTAAFIYYAEKPRCCPFLLLNGIRFVVKQLYTVRKGIFALVKDLEAGNRMY